MSVLFSFICFCFFFNPLAESLDPQVLSIGYYAQKCNAQLQNEWSVNNFSAVKLFKITWLLGNFLFLVLLKATTTTTTKFNLVDLIGFIKRLINQKQVGRGS